MTSTRRKVLPEMLDELAPDDPRARRSRRDLRRVHLAMGSLSILSRSILGMRLAKRPKTIIELGAGDGTMLLRLARVLQPPWTGVSLTLLDRHDLLGDDTRDAYRQLGWEVTVLRSDVRSWAREPTTQRYDLGVAMLFLHHFDAGALSVLMTAVAARTNAFVACEPRRYVIADVGSRLVGMLGVNQVTRADAVTSVAAGFRGRELTSIWPGAADSWITEESLAPPFIHRFVAVRTSAGG